MARRLVFGLVVTVVCLGGWSSRPTADVSSADGAFETFWSASSPGEAARLAEPILKSGVGFDEAYKRLQRGRSYVARDTGVVRMENRTSDGVEHFFAVNVPENYDPAHRYQVRIQLQP